MKLTIPTDKSYLAIIDFEATCSNDGSIPRNESEIIEFAAVIVKKNNFKIVKKYSKFVKPVIHPSLTEFCKNLTSISQENIDQADTFDIVLQDFRREVLEAFNYDVAFCSWGNYDKNILKENCDLHGVKFPFEDENHINLKNFVWKKVLNRDKARGISATLNYLGMVFKGRKHRGIDDAINIVRILKAL